MKDPALRSALAWLERTGTARARKDMARYALPSDKAYGVPFGVLKARAKLVGRNHALAVALWQTGRFEARMLAVLVDEPEKVTAAQMHRWCRDFDNWGICDTACFCLFDRTPQAWAMVRKWAKRREEYVKRAAFALIWSLSVHDKTAPDANFLRSLPLIEAGARDERLYVKKAGDMALRATGKRNPRLRAAAITLAKRLAASDADSARWIGRHTLKELMP